MYTPSFSDKVPVKDSRRTAAPLTVFSKQLETTKTDTVAATDQYRNPGSVETPTKHGTEERGGMAQLHAVRTEDNSTKGKTVTEARHDAASQKISLNSQSSSGQPIKYARKTAAILQGQVVGV